MKTGARSHRESAERVQQVRVFKPESMPLGVRSETGVLKAVLVSPPDFLTTENPISPFQKYFAEIGVNVDNAKAKDQHKRMVDELSKNATVYALEPSQERSEGVYTRDPYLVVDESFYKLNMKADVRKSESSVIEGGRRCRQMGRRCLREATFSSLASAPSSLSA